MKTYMCLICGYIYSEKHGDPEHGISPGTKWSSIPDDWKCPDCESTKSDFDMIEI